jgi:hypothetical protein
MQVEIPGGTAEIRNRATVLAQQTLQEEYQPLRLIISERWPKIEKLSDIPTDEYDPAYIRAFHRWRRAGVVALLKSWTLTDNTGKPIPLPTLDTVGEMDPEVYDPLEDAVLPIMYRAMNGMRFDEASAVVVENGKLKIDQQSPTQPSRDSVSGGPETETPTMSHPTGSSGSTVSSASVG